MPKLQFWYEFASTYSYPAAMRIGEAAARRGVEVDWRPFLLGPIFADQGWRDSPFNIYPAKGAYMWRDLERICEAYGLPFRRPALFPQRSVSAARIALVLSGDERAAFSRRVYAAQFGEGANIAGAAVLGRLLSESGADPAGASAGAESDEVRAALREATDEARRLGIFGAPSFLTPGGELFWGDDRLDQALDWTASGR